MNMMLKIKLGGFMKKIFITILIVFLVSVGCSKNPTEANTDNALKIDYFLSDSLGIPKTTFYTNEDIYLHFKIENISNEEIEYKKVSYIDDLISFSVLPIEETVTLNADFMPPLESIESHIQKSGEVIKSIDKFSAAEIGNYYISICPYVIYNRADFNLSSIFRIDFQIIEERKK